MREGAALGNRVAHCANCSTELPRFLLNTTDFGSAGGSCSWVGRAILESGTQLGRGQGAFHRSIALSTCVL